MTRPPNRDAALLGAAPSLGDLDDVAHDLLGDALSEVAILRVSLQSAIIGSQIIERQFERADEGTILHWAYRQAKANREHEERSLVRSREDFPHEGIMSVGAALAQRKAMRLTAAVGTMKRRDGPVSDPGIDVKGAG